MAKKFGGSASRIEVYALFVAAVVLIGGSISGAVVLTAGDNKPVPVAQSAADTTIVDTSVVATEAPTTAAPQADTQAPATTQAQRQNNPGPPQVAVPDVTVPVQDWSAFCVMPNLVGLSLYADYDTTTVSQAMDGAGCRLPFSQPTAWCVDTSLANRTNICCGGRGSVRTQTPAAGTLVHRTMGSYGYTVGWYPERSLNDTTGTAPPERFTHGRNPC